MRQTIQSFTPGTAVIQTRADASDGQGGFTSVFAAASTVSARIAPATGDERIQAGRVAEVQQYMMTIADTATVYPSSRISYGGTVYEVHSVKRDMLGPVDLCQRVLVTRVG